MGNIIRNAESYFGGTTPKPGSLQSSIGVQAKAPTTPPQTNSLPKNQINTSTQKPAVQSSTANGTAATAPMVGGKTFAQASQGITDRNQLGALARQYQTPQTTTQTPPVTQATTQSTTQPTTPPASTQTAAPQGYTQNKGLHGQLIAGLANQGNSQYQTATSADRAQLENMSTNTSDIDAARAQLAKQIGLDTSAQAAIKSEAIPLEFQQGRGQVLQQAQMQKEAQLQGLLGNLLTQRGQQQSGLASAAGISQGQQSQQQGALQSAAGFSSPQQVSPTNVPFDPVTGTYGTPAATAYDSAGGLAGVGAALAQQQIGGDFANKYAQGNATLNAAGGIESQIVNTLNSNPSINSQDSLSILNNLNQLVSGQIGSPAQQKLAQQISSYISTLGIDPATAVNIATQNRGSIKDLLSSLKNTYQTSQVDPYNPANLSQGSSGKPASSGSSGGSSSGYKNGGAF